MFHRPPTFVPCTIFRDVVYCAPDNAAQDLDIFFPAESDKPAPAVIYVHGGAWRSCDKDSAFFFPLMKSLQNAGFLVAAINYRLAPRHLFPAQIIDARCAVRFLRQFAADLHIDPDRIGAFGDSAGGHMVSLMGLAGESAGWDTAEYSGISSQVQAVVNLYGISDVSKVFGHDGSNIWPEVFNVDGDDNDPRLKAASPLTYIHSSTPPFLIIHGDKDAVVPYEHSVWLHGALKQAGSQVEFLTVKNADHQFVQVGPEPVVPDLADIFQRIVDFFVRELTAIS
jgi:acetyl esterase/lipase